MWEEKYYYICIIKKYKKYYMKSVDSLMDIDMPHR